MIEAALGASFDQKEKLIRGASFTEFSFLSGLHFIRGEVRSINCSEKEKSHQQHAIGQLYYGILSNSPNDLYSVHYCISINLPSGPSSR